MPINKKTAKLKKSLNFVNSTTKLEWNINKEKIIDSILMRLGSKIMNVEITSEGVEQMWKCCEAEFELCCNTSKITVAKKNKIASTWIELYCLASLCELLGIVRGKFKGSLPIPDVSMALNYEFLLKKGQDDKKYLKSLITNKK